VFGEEKKTDHLLKTCLEGVGVFNKLILEFGNDGLAFTSFGNQREVRDATGHKHDAAEKSDGQRRWLHHLSPPSRRPLPVRERQISNRRCNELHIHHPSILVDLLAGADAIECAAKGDDVGARVGHEVGLRSAALTKARDIYVKSTHLTRLHKLRICMHPEPSKWRYLS
jgi:hypothetical protein